MSNRRISLWDSLQTLFATIYLWLSEKAHSNTKYWTKKKERDIILYIVFSIPIFNQWSHIQPLETPTPPPPKHRIHEFQHIYLCTRNANSRNDNKKSLSTLISWKTPDYGALNCTIFSHSCFSELWKKIAKFPEAG